MSQGTTNVKNEDYYIGCCRCYQMKYQDGSICTEEDAVIWFGESDGYASGKRDKARAYRFPSADAVRKGAPHQDGMPWWYRYKPNTLRIYHVQRTTTVTCVETETELTA